MLITTCTHCLARFRVSPVQLNAKQGRVRCGRCGKVFSGFEALERFPDDDTGARLLAAREAADRAVHAPAIESFSVEDLPDIESLDAPALSAHPEPEPEAAQAEAAPMHHAPPAPVILEEEFDAPIARVSRAWSFGVALLCLVLSAELAFAFRSPIAQRYPAARPWLESACGSLGCTISWSRDERLLKLEDSELLEVPGKPNEIALGARIRNLASVPQEYPYMELTLTDLGGQPATRRVLRPADYLGRAIHPGEAFAAGAEISIQLRLETPRIKATGYELLLFYP